MPTLDASASSRRFALSSNDIWVLAELDGGQPKKIAREMVSKAAELAKSLGGKATAVVLAGTAVPDAASLGEYGAAAVYLATDARFDQYLVTPQVDALAALAKEHQPKAILVGATLNGRDIAARLAARLRTGLNSQVTDVKALNGGLSVTMPIFGGALVAECGFAGEGPAIILARPNAFAAVKGGSPAQVIPFTPAIGEAALAKITSRVAAEGSQVNLEESPVVVSGGRGVCDPGNFSLVRDLADTLGGAVGASRAAVDAGWMPYPHQVGQTGKTVKPSLYLACGISGAIQHKVGMQTANRIVAINKDAEAPIFSFADFGVVGNVLEIMPLLTKEIKQRKGG
jgi:electron transfer flavoprotein alpha subunit